MYQVKLVTDCPNQICMLEWLLITNHIEYKIITAKPFSIETPFLLVDGVPLDFDRSIKWIEEYEHD